MATGREWYVPLHRGAAAFWETGAPCLQAMWIINQTETMTINSSEAVLLAAPFLLCVNGCANS